VIDDADPEAVVDTGVKLPYEVVTLPSESVLTAKDRDSVRLVTRPSERVPTKTPKRSVLVEEPVLVEALPVDAFVLEGVILDPDEVVLALAAKTEKEVKVEEPLVMTTGEDVREAPRVVVNVPFECVAELAAEMMAGTRLVG